MDIHNTIEVLKLIDSIALAVKDPSLGDFGNIMHAGKKALDDIDKIIEELKDLDTMESLQLVNKLFETLSIVLDTLTQGKKA